MLPAVQQVLGRPGGAGHRPLGRALQPRGVVVRQALVDRRSRVGAPPDDRPVVVVLLGGHRDEGDDAHVVVELRRGVEGVGGLARVPDVRLRRVDLAPVEVVEHLGHVAGLGPRGAQPLARLHQRPAAQHHEVPAHPPGVTGDPVGPRRPGDDPGVVPVVRVEHHRHGVERPGVGAVDAHPAVAVQLRLEARDPDRGGHREAELQVGPPGDVGDGDRAHQRLGEHALLPEGRPAARLTQTYPDASTSTVTCSLGRPAAQTLQLAQGQHPHELVVPLEAGLLGPPEEPDLGEKDSGTSNSTSVR